MMKFESKKVFGFQEYTADPRVGASAIAWRVLLLASIVVFPVVGTALWLMFKTLPTHAYLILGTLTLYIPLFFYRKKPLLRVRDDFQVEFHNSSLDTRLLRASLVSVGIFAFQAILWTFGLMDHMNR